MTYTLTDYIRGFQKFNRVKCFSSSVQSTFLAIACEFDAQGFPDEIELSARELQLRSGLKSVSTVHEAKNVLKVNRLIDFRTKKKQQVTFFTLCSGHLTKCSLECSIERSGEHLTEQGTEHSTEQEGLISCTQNTELSAAAPLPLPPTPPIPIPDNNNIYKSASQQAGSVEDVLELWERKTGKELASGEQEALKTFDKYYGRDTIELAIATFLYKKGKQFNFFHEWCLKPLLADMKGGEGNGQAVGGVCMDRRAGGSAGGIQATAMATSTGKPSGKGRFDDLPPEELM